MAEGVSHDGTGPAAPLAGPGPRLVFFEYVISLVFLTLRRPSRLYALPPGSRGLWQGLPYTLASLLLGWWGVPWGLVYTPLALWTNLTGGREVTAEEWARTAGPAGPAPRRAAEEVRPPCAAS
jgi:hypothetical protein